MVGYWQGEWRDRATAWLAEKERREMAMTDSPERAAGNARGRWLQIGLLAATAFAPLLARWQSLRDDDRAQALRERASALRERATVRAAQAAGAARALRRSLRRAGPSDDVASGISDFSDLGDTNASDDLASASPAPLERLASLAPLAAAPLAPLAEMADMALNGGDRRGRARRTTFWLAGASAGLIAAGVVTYIVIRNRQLAREERATYHAMALDPLDTEDLTTPTRHAPMQMAPETPTRPPALEPDFAPPPAFTEQDEAGAQWVGDIFTHVYAPLHEAGDTDHPAAGRRIFFATEEDALDAGYHRSGTSPAGRD